ncbi:HNH endonuclease [Haliscomenobacter hydrossis]|uniref:HNH endonuclease n=1 Tax=Haliscomenobacter hydrossis TaxID=2350 RepID=UPI0005C503D5|nr:HNH endonuclease [Haliscomenobacter hydrossis]
MRRATKIIDSLDNTLKEDLDFNFSTVEGKLVLRIHKTRERDYNLVDRKKQQFFLENGALFCEICGFDFEKIYGELGKGYIECHHILPISQLEEPSVNTLHDLICVCSNCHKMMHRNGLIAPEDLRVILKPKH